MWGFGWRRVSLVAAFGSAGLFRYRLLEKRENGPGPPQCTGVGPGVGRTHPLPTGIGSSSGSEKLANGFGAA